MKRNIMIHGKEVSAAITKRYLSKLTDFSQIDQTTIYKINENDQKYSSLTSDNENLIFTKEEIADIISKNELNNSRYVYVPNIDFNDKFNFDYKKISSFLNGYIEYSKTLSVNIDYNSKIINLKQNNPEDWILFVNVNFDEWSISFKGIKTIKKRF